MPSGQKREAKKCAKNEHILEANLNRANLDAIWPVSRGFGNPKCAQIGQIHLNLSHFSTSTICPDK